MSSLKKWGKKSLSILFVCVMLVSFAVIAFAEGADGEDGSSAADSSISVVESGADDSSVDSSVPQEDLPQEDLPPAQAPPAQAPPAQAPPAQAPAATGTPSVSGKMVGLSSKTESIETAVNLGAGSVFSTDAYTGVYTGMTLVINANFDGDGLVTDRQIIITLAKGLAFKSLPGVVINQATRTVGAFNPAALAGQERDAIKNITINTEAPLSSNTMTVNQLGGTAVIELEEGTVALELKISIMYDALYAVKQDASKGIDNAVQLDVKQTNQGSAQSGTVSLEKFVCISKAGAVIYRTGEFDKYYLPGDNVNMKYFINSTLESYTNTSSEPIYYKKLVFEIRIPKNVFDFSGATLLESVAFSTQQWANASERKIEDASNSINHVIKFTLENFITNISTFTINLRVKASVTQGAYAATSLVTNIETHDGTAYTAPIYGQAHSWRIYVPDPANVIATPQDYSGLKVAYAAPADVTAGENVYLGSYLFLNTTGKEITSQKATIDFTGSAGFGVRLVRLPVGVDWRANKVKVTLSNGQTVDYATYNYGLATNGTAPYVSMDIIKICKDIGGDPKVLYIQKIEYTINRMAASYASGELVRPRDLLMYHPGAVFGAFLGAKPASIDFKITVSNADGTMPKSVNVSYPVSAKGMIGFSSSTSVSSEGNATSLAPNVLVSVLGGKSFNVNANFSIYGQSSSGTHTVSGEFAPAFYSKGFVFYIRTLDFMTIEGIVIKSALNGKSYTVGDGLTLSTITDNTGKKVLKIVAPDLSTGVSALANNTSSSPTINITYNVSLKKASPILSCKFSDLLFVHSTATNIEGDYNGNIKYFNELDNFGISGTTNQTQDTFGTLHNGAVLKVTGEEEFTVITSAQMTMDSTVSPWVSYNFGSPNPDEILGLSPLGKVEFKVEMVNNSGKNCNGYSVIIYIPKAGESVGGLSADGGTMNSSYVQKDAFQWSTWLENELVISSLNGYNYTVKYSTAYETTILGTTYESWNEDNKMDYRTIMVTTTDVVADGENDEFVFGLQVPAENPEDYAGLTNIYSARVYRVLGSVESYKPSQPVAVTLNTAAVKGRVYIDENWSGEYEANVDKVLPNVELRAFREKPGVPGEKELIKTLYSDANGEYSFPLYGLDDTAWVEAVNPSTKDDYRFSGDLSKPLNKIVFERDGTAGELRHAGNPVLFNIGLERRCVVKFNGNGGNPNATRKEFRKTVIPFADMKEITPDRPGHTFLGWYKGGEKGQFVTGEAAYTVTGDVDLYARWTGDRFNLRYWVGEKSTSYKVGIGTPLNQKGNTPPAVKAPAGKQFAGWADSAGKVWKVNTELMPAYDLDLYAKFTSLDGSDSSSQPDESKLVTPNADKEPPKTNVPELAANARWSIISLLGVIIGLLCAVVAIVSILGKRAKRGAKIAAIVLGALTVPFFFFMNSLGGIMVLVNLSTLFIIPLAIVALVLVILFLKKTKETDENEEQEGPYGYEA